jgi:uncharacterized phiE125 gp8 family phage protein
MWGEVVVSVEPAAEPVPLEQLIQHCRAAEDGTDDAVLNDAQKAARAHVEAVTGTRLVTQTVEVKAESWNDLAALPIAPIQAVSSIAYVDTDGATQTLAGAVYDARIEGLAPLVVLKHGQAWPPIQPGSRITLTAVVGYGEPGSQPPSVLHAIRLIVGDFYANRETVQVGSVAGRIPMAGTVEALLANHTRTLTT